VAATPTVKGVKTFGDATMAIGILVSVVNDAAVRR
jgi:hypothetical protein